MGSIKGFGARYPPGLSPSPGHVVTLLSSPFPSPPAVPTPFFTMPGAQKGLCSRWVPVTWGRVPVGLGGELEAWKESRVPVGWGGSRSSLLHVFFFKCFSSFFIFLFFFLILEQDEKQRGADRFPISLFQLEAGRAPHLGQLVAGSSPGDALQGRDPPRSPPGSLRCPPALLQVSPKAPVRMDLTLAVPGR